MSAKEAAEAVMKSAIKRSAAKAEQMQSAKEAAEAVMKSAIKRLQAERTVNKGYRPRVNPLNLEAAVLGVCSCSRRVLGVF